ncbi:hypothetical protein D9756_009353 [Leucocoprinus leucothites]|uniref:Uncharacterized protein n=1 Tax=Leucocoprinus leucothites TaxID=201217 RepID=A0A8H5CX32_9AGAR|nr:hypothetical protein D9756_009353 [Leucoagaricus leucothites]
MVITMDNAVNCDKLAVHLPTYIPTFCGPKMHVQCIAHILNLIAKAFMSFFFKKLAKKTNAILKDRALVVEERETELDDVVAEEMDENDDILVDDDGHRAFNYATAHSLHDQAILLMQNEGVTVSAHELQMAQQIMPQVARLACQINDSPKLYKLGCYQLTDKQWELAEDLAEALEIQFNILIKLLFEEPTWQFSQKGVPLIIDVLPILLELKFSMQAIHDSDTDDDPAYDITCIAAQAAILDCEIYYISIVMCPDCKLQWFKSALGFTTQYVKKIKDMVVEHWKASYASGGDEKGKKELVQGHAQSSQDKLLC